MQTSWFWSLNAPLYLIWTERLVIIAQESTGKCGTHSLNIYSVPTCQAFGIQNQVT